jgi:hypothetical protein
MRWNKFPPLFLFTGYTVGVRFAEHLDDIEPVIGAGLINQAPTLFNSNIRIKSGFSPVFLFKIVLLGDQGS